MASTQDQFPTTDDANAAEGSDARASDATAAEVTDDANAAADAAAAEVGAAEVVRKRPRRATKKASAPAPAPEPEVTAAEPAVPAAEPGVAPAEPQPADATAAGAATAGEAGDAGDAADAAGATRVAKKAAKKPTRKAARKTTSRTKDTASEVGTEVGGAEAPAAGSGAAEVDAESEVGEAAAAAAPSFGVLFQAPEPAPAPARRRTRSKAAQRADETEVADRVDRADRADRVERADSVEHDAADQRDETDQREEAAEAAEAGEGRRRRRRGGKGRRGRGAGDADSAEEQEAQPDTDARAKAERDDEADRADAEDEAGTDETGTSRRRRRRRRSGAAGESEDPPGTVTKVRESRRERDEPQSVKGSTRLEAKKQRRREGREAGRRRTVITEAEFLARRESVERVMVVRERDGRTQIGVLEDDVLVEHYVSRETNGSMAGNVYLGRVQNVLPSMEAAFVDIGKGRNAVLYAGEVNWDAAGLETNAPKRIENALKSGDTVLVQVTKDPIGHKGARLTSQISLPGRYLVYVPEGNMTGISRKLPDTERARLKTILKEVVPDSAGVIVRTAAEGASEEELRADVERLSRTWEKITTKAEAKASGKGKGGAPMLVHGEPDLTVRVIRDVFNEDFTSLVVSGEKAYAEVSEYLGDVAPDLAERLTKWTSEEDLFTRYRVDEQIAKAMDRKVWLPSGGSLVIDRTEAMTVIDVNTGKFVGSGGNLEETVTKNNIEAAEEIVRQLRLRDIGGIIVIDFIDMVLESNRDLVVRRLLECLGRDRTKHQVAEVTSLGLVQMTRKRVGSGLIEVFSETCEHCNGRGILVHSEPVDKPSGESNGGARTSRARSRGKAGAGGAQQAEAATPHTPSGPTPAQIAAAAHAAAIKGTAAAEHAEPALEVLEGEAESAPPITSAADRVAEPSGAPAEAEATVEPVESAADRPVELVGSAPDEPAEPAEPESAGAPATPAEEPPAPPKRRKRGRVVAPAGPPRAAAAEPVPAAADEVTSDAS